MFASLFASAVQAAVEVQLEVDQHTEGGPGAQNLPPDRHEAISAVLGDGWMTVRRGARTTCFDFSQRRHTEIDETSHTRVDYPLYDVVGFRVMEFANRMNLGRAMAAAKITQVQFDPVETEHALSVQERPGRPLSAAVDGGETVYAYGAKALARVSLQTTPVPSAQARMFAQLLRYTWGGHPQLLAALAESNAIPSALALVLPQGGTGVTTVKLRVLAARPSDAGPLAFSAVPLQAASAAPTAVQKVLARGAALGAADIAAARQRVLDLIEAGFREHRAFDAYLAIIEWSLTSGEAPPAMDPARKEAVKADPSVMALSAALAPHSKAELQWAIDQLDALRPQTRAQAYMLDLFIANDRALMGDSRAALAGLAELLLAHPFIAGAYKDLGDNLFQTYDTPSAWRSWEIGRAIAPGFANFQPIAQFERQLVTQHPEYF